MVFFYYGIARLLMPKTSVSAPFQNACSVPLFDSMITDTYAHPRSLRVNAALHIQGMCQPGVTSIPDGHAGGMKLAPQCSITSTKKIEWAGFQCPPMKQRVTNGPIRSARDAAREHADSGLL